MTEHNTTDQSPKALRRVQLLIQGRVQGVGFRPTLHRRLTEMGCAGSIRNTPLGVELFIEGDQNVVEKAVTNFRSLVPERARVDSIDIHEQDPVHEQSFTIERSSSRGMSLLPIPPDLATCETCRQELQNPKDRRYKYPFNTCTACGPRFTIARDIPFDRPTSAMADYPLCGACEEEYETPRDRRFHAQTMSCPDCGPQLHLDMISQISGPESSSPILHARELLTRGYVVAIKGLGGFHLACDATADTPVQKLRRRKNRPHKPLALMAADMETCEDIARPSQHHKSLLTSPEAPIVLLPRRAGSGISPFVAPGLTEIGIMLPYTPLHILLFEDCTSPNVLVMTSCNRSREPMAIQKDKVTGGLSDIADAVLWHDRPVENRCDDSLMASVHDLPLPMRRSRGYVPEPIILPRDGARTFATGAMWKNTFALTTTRRAFLSQHIGDVSDADNARHFRESFRRFSHLLDVDPELVACDMHPDYPTTRIARDLAERCELPLFQIQHHHAHLASCLAENNQEGPTLGVSMDGTGYGEDGYIWGGEFMAFDLKEYDRQFHLNYVPMPGGEAAVREPWRMALSHLASAEGVDAALRRISGVVEEEQCENVAGILQDQSLSPLTSSCGRMFDAASALLGIRPEISYDGQAACELEACADRSETGAYGWGYDEDAVLTDNIFSAMCRDLDRDLNIGTIAARFHNTIADVIIRTCLRMRNEHDITSVALSGGVMQNRFLLEQTIPGLERQHFDVLLQTRVPPNDGGICLGQAAVARTRAGSG
ncbi:MAG: carbamoyltransferase HypF [Planctomycetota bacterium]